MKTLKIALIFSLLFLLYAVSTANGQSRTNRIYRPCSATGTPAIVEVERDGDINIRPCSGKTLKLNGTDISIAQPFEISVAVTDEVTDIAAVNNALTFHVPRSFTAAEIWAGLSTVSSSGVVTVDVNKNGVTVFSTKITVDASEETSLTALTAAVLSSTTFVKGDKITIDIDTAGTGAKGLKVYFLGTR